MDNQKIDGRVRRTKKLLREGLTKLMKEKSIKKISVRELSDLVEINRGTFYLHYKDIFELVDQIENELFEEFESIINQYSANSHNSSPYPVFVDCCRFLEKNKDICSALLGSNGDIDFSMKLKKFMAERCFEEFTRYNQTPSFKEEYNYIYSYFEAGAVGIVRYWLTDTSDTRKTPEDVALMLDLLFTKGFSGFEK